MLSGETLQTVFNWAKMVASLAAVMSPVSRLWKRLLPEGRIVVGWLLGDVVVFMLDPGQLLCPSIEQRLTALAAPFAACAAGAWIHHRMIRDLASRVAINRTRNTFVWASVFSVCATIWYCYLLDVEVRLLLLLGLLVAMDWAHGAASWQPSWAGRSPIPLRYVRKLLAVTLCFPAVIAMLIPCSSVTPLRFFALSFTELSGLSAEYRDLRFLRAARGKRLNLSNAKLTGAKLTCANLTGAQLSGATLNHADARKATLLNVDIDDAKFIGARLRGATIGRRKESTKEADLECADIQDAEIHDLDHARLVGVLAKGAVMRGSLYNTDLSGADLQEAQGLEQMQLNTARGDDATKLPPKLHVRCGCPGPLLSPIPFVAPKGTRCKEACALESKQLCAEDRSAMEVDCTRWSVPCGCTWRSSHSEH